jgi:Na+/H+ antiporter NhaC
MVAKFTVVLFMLFILSSFVFAGSSMSTNFVIRDSDDVYVNDDKDCVDYLFWFVVILIIVYILFRLNLKKSVYSPKKKITRKKKGI